MGDQHGETFSQALRRYRLSAGLSQEALAERAGLSVRGISDLERGRRRMPRLETIRMLADALELDESALAELVLASRPDLIPAPTEISPSPAVLNTATTNSDRSQHTSLLRQPTPLIGRAREVEDVSRMLRQTDTRLVTLTGPGGAGKTRLAIQVGTELANEFREGVFFVALAPLTHPELVLPAIAETLGVRDSNGTSLQTALIAHLRDRQLLLLLDNLEHVLDASPAIEEILASCAHLKVIVTSRVTLHLRMERIFDVPPLSLPEIQNVPSTEQVEQYSALALFVDRAQAAASHFTVTPDNISAINAICQRLDGLPLAIELAATRIRILSVQELLALLQRRLPLLTGGDRDLPERHQTLWNTIAWSYDLLTEQDRKLYRRLSIFSGGWTLEAAEAVTVAAEDQANRLAVLDSLAVIVDHSLVRPVGHTDDASRFDMLETIREFGIEQLTVHHELEEVSQRHAAYFLAFIEHQGFDVVGAEEAARLTRIETDYDNVRAALGWSLDHPDPVLALSLGSALREFWSVRGHLNEGRAWLHAALALQGDAPAPIRARALDAASSLACHLGDLDTADLLAEESLVLNRQLADNTGIANALHILGLSAQLREDYKRARHLYEECIVLKRQSNHPRMSWTVGNLAQVAFHLGDTQRAVELFDECITLARAGGDTATVGVFTTDLALVLLESGDDARAGRLFFDALKIHHEIGHVRLVVSTIEGMAALAGKYGRPEQAARMYGAAELLCEDTGYRREDPDPWRYEHYVQLARAQTDKRAFSAAWAAGRTMTMDHAVRYALGTASVR